MKKTALITGGSSGLGYAFAEILGKQGYAVVILARDQEKINTAVNSLLILNISASGISCSITDEEGLKTAFTLVKEKFGTLDYLILNAGVVTTKLLCDYENAAELKKDLDTDLWGTVLCTYQFLPLLNKGGKILMTSSGLGLMGAAGYSIYCAAKAGILNFGEALRRELLCRKIGVYVACPGDMDTPQYHEEMKNSPQWMRKATPRKLMVTTIVAKKILMKANGEKRFLILPSADVNLLVILGKILPRQSRDFMLDKMFPRPKD